jgi:hypothetical protein
MTAEQAERAAELAAFFLRDDREEEEAVDHDGGYHTDPATGVCRYCDGRHPIEGAA